MGFHVGKDLLMNSGKTMYCGVGLKETFKKVENKEEDDMRNASVQRSYNEKG